MSWYCLDLGNAAVAYGPTTKLQELFLRAFAAAGQPPEMAMYSRFNRENGTVTVFFSPAALQFAEKLNGAHSCERPSLQDIGLLVGDQRSWDILFPERQQSR